MSSASNKPSAMCFKVGKYLTTNDYAKMMKSLAWFLSDRSTSIEFVIQFTSRIGTKARILTPPEICTEIDKLTDYVDNNMDGEFKEFIIYDYTHVMLPHCTEQ